jgi:hypothetical protein
VPKSYVGYDMFSKAGDRRVEAIVSRVAKEAKDKNYTADQAGDRLFFLLEQLSDKKGFGEAYDTAVREDAWEALEGRLKDMGIDTTNSA